MQELLLAGLLMTSTLVPLPIRRPTPIPAAQSTPFEIMLKEIRSAKLSGDWKEPGWQYQTIEAELDRVIAQIRLIKGDDLVALPVRFKDVSPGGHMGKNGVKELYVGAEDELRSMKKSIILAHGSVSITSAEDCVIIARGGVKIGMGGRNVIIAGQCVHVEHDGSLGKGSLILSNDWLGVSTSIDGGIYSSPEMDLGSVGATTIINPRKIAIKSKRRPVVATDGDLYLFPPPSNPLEKLLTINSIEFKGHWTQDRATFTDSDGKRFDIEIGGYFADKGRPRPGLAGWGVNMITSEFVIVSNGTQDVCFPKSRSR